MSRNPPIAYDMTRLCYAPSLPTPRGIDRVEFGLCEFFFRSWPAECVVILPTPWGVRRFERDVGLKILDSLANRWNERESTDHSQDPAYLFVKSALAGQQKTRRFRPSRSVAPVWQIVISRIYEITHEVGFTSGADAGRHTPPGALYLNLGHSGLAMERLLRWLSVRPDITPVFMLHDAIPMDYPEFVTPGAHALFKKMIENTRQRAQALIVTTEAAKRSVLAALGDKAPPDERIFASQLPVVDAFRKTERHDEIAEHSYFIFCGSVEPRKNLVLLLSIWHKIVMRLGGAAPALVVVGTRTSRVCETAAVLDRRMSLDGHLIEVEGLSTDGLRRLMASARALLMPSFAEGFGIPIIEALASGTPVIASDIEAHREAGGHRVQYIDPTDGPAWMSAILSLNDHPRREAPDVGLQNWSSYTDLLSRFLCDLPVQPRSSADHSARPRASEI